MLPDLTSRERIRTYASDAAYLTTGVLGAYDRSSQAQERSFRLSFERLCLTVNGFTRNQRVLDLRVTVGEAPALFFFLLRSGLRCLCGGDPFIKFCHCGTFRLDAWSTGTDSAQTHSTLTPPVGNRSGVGLGIQ